MIKLLTNEKLYFQHKCIHDKAEGQLYVTSMRYTWYPSSNMLASFDYTWNNINKVRYTPANDPKGRSAMNLDLTVSSPTGSTYFELIGRSKEDNRFHLEQVKSIIGAIKRGDISAIDQIQLADPSNTAYSDSRPLHIDASSSSSSRIAPPILSEEKKRMILETNQFIRNQYQDLVIENKILEEDDFWIAYGPQRDESLFDKQSKGKTSSYFIESIKLGENEWEKVPEAKKRSIFKVYPMIKKAYDQKEECNVSEEDFWRRYAYSFRHDSDGIDELFLRSIMTDQLESGGSLKKESNSNRGTVSSLNDLHDDYYRRSIDDSIREYDEAGITNKNSSSVSSAAALKEDDRVRTKRLLTGGWNEFNQQSKLILESSSSSSTATAYHHPKKRQLEDEVENELVEIQSDKNPRGFYPLQIRNENSKATEGRAKNADHEIVEEDQDSAFGKAKVIVKRSNLRESVEKLSASYLMSSMNSVFPSSEQATSYHQQNIRDLHSLTITAAAASSQGGSTLERSDHLPGSSAHAESENLVDGHELSEEFKQDVGEYFVRVTERMRHFYKLLHREGTLAPSPGSATEKKILTILEDLIRINDQLSSKKTKLMNTLPKGKVLDASIMLINDIVTLIQRVKFVWHSYQGINQ
jgi:hypothetical protein